MDSKVLENEDTFRIKVGVEKNAPIGGPLLTGVLIAIIAGLLASKVFALSGIPLLIAIIMGGPTFSVFAVVATAITTLIGGTVAAYLIEKFKNDYKMLDKKMIRTSFSGGSVHDVGKYCAKLIFYPQIMLYLQSEESPSAVWKKLEANFKSWGYSTDFGTQFVFDTCKQNAKNADKFEKEIIKLYELSLDQKKYAWISKLVEKNLKKQSSRGTKVEKAEILTETFIKNIRDNFLETYLVLPEPTKRNDEFYKKIIAIIDKRLGN